MSGSKDKAPSFPRIRGDVPARFYRRSKIPSFSPHTRGCSSTPAKRNITANVFPAYAGMFRRWRRPEGHARRFPRIRGDVPTKAEQEALEEVVFPAYAGMFRSRGTATSAAWCFPRIRGDVPQSPTPTTPCTRFSPHTRGCSYFSPGWFLSMCVFPAYAGMFRRPGCAWVPSWRFPRIRGDVPLDIGGEFTAGEFSPHTRGCSEMALAPVTDKPVFPAYAGMFRASKSCRCPL